MSKMEDILSASSNADSPPLADPFSKFVLGDQSVDSLAGIQVLTSISVRKPRGDEWFQVHPAMDHRRDVLGVKSGQMGDLYVVDPALASVFGNLCKRYTVFLCVNRSGTPFLWMIRPDVDMPWTESALQAAAMATKEWTRIESNKDAGRYSVFKPPVDAPAMEPRWPTQPFLELLHMGFKNNQIDDLAHPIVRKIQGYE